MPRRHRSHSMELKRQIVAEYHSGETLHGLSKRHDICRNPIRIWIAKAEVGEFDDEVATADLPVAPEITAQRRDRLKCALHTIDGRRQGASYRGVPKAFFGKRRVVEEDWKTSPLKAQVARLAVLGRMMMDRGYRMLLRKRLVIYAAS